MSTPPATWSYSGDPSTSDKDEVRFLLQDVDPNVPLLSDPEIQYLVDIWQPRYGSNTMVAAVAAAVVARKLAGMPPVQGDGIAVDLSALSKTYTGLAQQLRAEYEQASDSEAEIDLSSIEWPTSPDSSIVPLNFSIGMHDNPDAGQQNYGGYYPLPAIDWAESAG